MCKKGFDGLSFLSFRDKTRKVSERFISVCGAVLSLILIGVTFIARAAGETFEHTVDLGNNKQVTWSCTVNDDDSSVSIALKDTNEQLTEADIKSVAIPSTVTDGTKEYSVTGIKQNGLRERTTLESITIPVGVTSIGKTAFQDCTALQSITIPSGVTTIANGTFFNCEKLSSVSIPKNVETIEQYAFYGTDLNSITIPSGVTTIAKGTFYDCKNLVSVTLHSAVTTIGEQAFQNCEALASINIPEGVTTIQRSAFYGAGITSITLPPTLTTIGNQAFQKSGLQSIEFPEGIEKIDGAVCRECKNLTSVTIPSTVTTIGDSAFKMCTSLPSIEIPESVVTIEQGAFWDCEALKSIDLSANNLTEISDSSFGYCLGLESIVIPTGVTKIGNAAFYNCPALTSLTIPENVTTIGEGAFDPMGNIEVALTDIYVKEGVSLEGTALSETANVWRYKVLEDQAGAAEGQTLVSITKHDQGEGDVVNCNAMSEPYFVKSVTAEGADLVHTYVADSYTWSDDNSKCTAVGICENGDNAQTSETVDSTSEITTPATCTDKGKTTYTATFTNPIFSEQTSEVEDVDALEHDWNQATYAWNLDGENWKCTAERVCKRDATHVESETVDSAKEVISATCTENGKTACTATFTNPAFEVQTQDVDIVNALGHDWDITVAKEVTDTTEGQLDSVCKVCGEEVSEVIPALSTGNVKQLTDNVKLGNKTLKCIVQDPYRALPEDAVLEVSLVEKNTDRWNELYKNLDDTHRVENVEFFEVNLYDAQGNKLPMPLDRKVRMLLQIPDGWTAEDLQAVLVMEDEDIEFEEDVVTIDGVNYLAFWADHFSPYAMIDTLTDEEDENVSTSDVDSEVSKSGKGFGGKAVDTGDSSGMYIILAVAVLIADAMIYVSTFKKNKC